jgi:hypothetical protein
MFGQCGIFHLVFTLKEAEYTQENYNTATGRKFSTNETLCEVEISEDYFVKGPKVENTHRLKRLNRL